MFNNKTEAYTAMRLAGFIPHEIKTILNAHVAKNPDKAQDILKIANSAPFQDMLKRRKLYVDKQLAKGYSRLHVMAQINQLYKSRNNKVSPFDFLKVEYTPVKKLSPRKFDKLMADKKQAAKQIEKLYGKSAPHPNPVLRYKPAIRKVPGA